MNAQTKILIIDDEPYIHDLMDDIFEDYHLIHYQSPQEGLEYFMNNPVDIVTLDVNMPGMDGYELCKKMRQSDKNNNPPVIFISAQVELNDIIKAYDSGGNDYITKPFKHQEILEKIKVVQQFHEDQIKLKEKLRKTRKTVLETQDASAKMGIICNFLQRVFFCKDIESLCNQLFKVTRHFGTKTTLRIHTQNCTQFIADDGLEHNINNSILEVAKDEERIFHFGQGRCIFNWERASLLVNKVSVDVDNLAILMDAFDKGLQAIEAEQKFNNLVIQVKETNFQTNSKVIDLFNAVVNDIQGYLQQQGSELMLSIEQEDELLKIAGKKRDDIDTLFAEGEQINNQLSDVMEEMRSDNLQVEEEDKDEMEFF